MSSAVREHIAALTTLLAEVSDPTQFAEQAAPVLAALRTLYPTNRAAFSPDDVRFLKQTAAAIEAAEDLADLLEDLPEVQADGDVVSYLEALNDLMPALRGSAVQLRVRRELRVLRQRFPGAKARLAEADKVNRLRDLETRAWPCRCGEMMTLRKGQKGLFWGCTTYPKCTYTHRLTEKQLARLG